MTNEAYMKKSIFAVLVLLFSIPTFAGSIKAADCQSTNWEQKGVEDGSRGEKIDVLYTYIKTCDKANAPFSADLYRKGREEGLYSFCSNTNAYNMGFKKTILNKGTCDNIMFPEFQAYYDKGLNYKLVEKQKFAVDKKVNSLTVYVQKLETAEAERKDLENQLKDLEFKPEMAKTTINRSDLMNTMSKPIDSDPKMDSTLNIGKPVDFKYETGDMMDRREPASKPKKTN